MMVGGAAMATRTGRMPLMRMPPLANGASIALAIVAAAGALPARAQDAAASAISVAGEAADAADAAAADAAKGSYSVVATSRLDGRVSNPLKMPERKLLAAAAKLDKLESYRTYSPAFTAWNDDLMRGIKQGSLASVSAAMAPRIGIPAAALQALARDWLIARIGGYNFSNEGDLGPVRPTFTAQVVQDLAAAGHAPFAIEIAAQTLNIGGNCDDPGFAAISAAAPDKVQAGWAIVRGSPCPALGFGALASPERRTTILLQLLLTYEAHGIDALPIADWLLADGGLSRVDSADAPRLRTWLTRKLIGSLIGAGMHAEALARLDALDPATRGAVLQSSMPLFAANVDGAELSIDADEDSLRLPLAAAMALAGRKGEADALLQGDPVLAESPKLFGCLYDKQGQPATGRPGRDLPCGLSRNHSDRRISNAIAYGYIREAIDQTGADPYPLVELAAGYDRSGESSGVMVTLRCRLLADPQYATLCRDARRGAARDLLAPADRDDYSRKRAEPVSTALAGAALPGWNAITAHYEALRVAALVAFTDPGIEPHRIAWSERPAVEPDPSPFAERSLPPELRSSPGTKVKDATWPRGWAPLPRGFESLRTGEAGKLAVAVSASSRLDPSGEVGRGGYWVHVSRDGGKTWQAPLYTGLAAYFPYVVPSMSQLPLLDGETIRLEVAVDLLDTRSITYPPVGLRTRRSARDLYLELPLAALQADGNDDGLTDIAAHHLLLDSAPPLAPFVVGSDLASCPAKGTPASELRARLLQRLIGGRQEAAVLEPINRPADSLIGFGWARSPEAKTGPLFIKGTAADFACMRLPFPALAYGEAGEEALQRKSPDFRLLELPPMIMNRAGTRGFAVWSFGWTGGTTLFVQEPDGGWQPVELSSWIT